MRVVGMLLVLLGCSTEPGTDTPLTPWPEYQVWWQEMERCSRRQGDYSEIRWYSMVSDVRGGYYLDRTIWINERYVGHRQTVAHEELHALGVKGHGGPEWKRCGIEVGY
jgi:hypothetical protein